MESKIDVVEVLPNLHMFRFPVGQAYLWREATELTLIDTGLPGYGDAITTAIAGLGLNPRDLRRIVITHFHEDHVGALAELTDNTDNTDNTDIEVLAHAADAPFVRGEPGPRPDLTESELAFVQSLPPIPTPAPARVDTELTGGEVLDFGGGAHVVSVPGHTDGSIAIHLPGAGVVFTGDTVGAVPGRTVVGPFNLDDEKTYRSVQRIAELDPRIACLGHGGPLTENTAQRIAAAERNPFQGGETADRHLHS
jgi:glyoxylase-like metal-dependent hydrolase (beta-lactamase superfamily II)